MHYKVESGLRLRASRDAKGLKLRELTAMTGLGISRISGYEQGERFMDPDAARCLARALGVRASWLMVIDDDDTMTPAERALVQKYRQTDSRGKQVIQSVADAQPEISALPADALPTAPPFVQTAKKTKPA